MSGEKELQEADFPEIEADDISNLVDFADLADLEDVDNMDVFGDLGDISDLGDVPDLSALGEMADSSGEEASAQEMPELSMDDILGEESLGDLSLDDVSGEDALGDLSLDDVSGEDVLGDLSLDDVSGEDALGDLSLDNVSGEEDLGILSLDDVSQEEEPEFSLEDLPGEESLENMDSQSVDMGDAIPDVMGLEEPGIDAVSEETSESEDSQMGGELSDTIALDDLNITEDGLLENLDIDFGALEETPAEEPSGDDGLGNMLDGLLDDLDMNGAIEETPEQEETESQDAMSELLGLDDTFFQEGEEKAESMDDLSLDMLDASDIMPEEKVSEEKEPGFFQRVFGNVVTDEIAEQEREAAKAAEEEAERKAEEDAKIKEEKDAKKAEKKAEKEAKAAARKKEKETKKAEKAKEKAEKKARQEEEAAAELEVVGKLNKVGVSIIVIATILFLVVEIGGTNLFSYVSAKNEALDYFEMGKYTEAYKMAIGTDMREKDSEEYDKIKTVMKVQQCLNAYQNYDRMKYYPEALDALLRGIKRYDANIEQATQLEVEKDMMSCRTQIISLLQSEFGISEAKAYSLLAMDKEDYQNEVIKIGVDKIK